MTAQPSLPLEPTPQMPLREAYERTASIKQRYTFSQAMNRPALAVCLRCLAEVIQRNREST